MRVRDAVCASLLLFVGLAAAQERHGGGHGHHCNGSPPPVRSLKLVAKSPTVMDVFWEGSCAEYYVVNVALATPQPRSGQQASPPRSSRHQSGRATLTNLAPGTPYSVTVVPVNRRGEGPGTSQVAATQAQGCSSSLRPGAPINAKATPKAADRVELTWQAPAWPSNACVEGFKIDAFEAASNTKVLDAAVAPSVLSQVVPGLKPSTRYKFVLTTQGRPGSSGQVVLFATTPGPSCRPMRPLPPSRVAGTPDGPDRLKLTWSNGDSSICVSDYSVEGFEVKSGKPVLKVGTVPPDATAVQLSPGVEYKFVITARGPGGSSPSTLFTTTMPGGPGPAGCQDSVPSQVRDFSAQPGGPGQLRLEWKAPKDVCVAEFVVKVRETGERFVVPPKGDKQAGRLDYQAPAGRAGSAFSFDVAAFSAPSKKEGVTKSFGPFVTAGPR